MYGKEVVIMMAGVRKSSDT